MVLRIIFTKFAQKQDNKIKKIKYLKSCLKVRQTNIKVSIELTHILLVNFKIYKI